MFPWLSINETTNEIQSNSGIISCIFYRNLVNTLTPTLFQSKSFSFRVPKSHSPERNATLAIRPKKTNNNISVLIPVMKENKWYVNCFWIFFRFAQWTQWIIVTSAILPNLSLDKDKQKPLHNFPVIKVFFPSFFAKFCCSKFWVDGTFQASSQTLKTKLRGLSPHANYTNRAAAAGRRS